MNPAPALDAVLMGYYGTRNLGDDLMMLCLTRVLQRNGCQVTILAENADEVRSTHRLEAEQNYALLGQFGQKHLLRGASFRLAARLADADVFLAGGGDILRDSLGTLAFSYQIEKLVWALMRGKPVALVNVGITTPVTRLGQTMLRWILTRCSLVIVRDQRSAELCRELAPDTPLKTLPDVVLALPLLFEAEVRTAPSPQPTQSGRGFLLVSLRHTANVYGMYEMGPDRIANLAAALDHVVSHHDLDICFFGCHDAPGEDDHRLHREIRSHMQTPDARIRMEGPTVDIRQLTTLFGSATAVLAMRLHAGVLGVAYGKPSMLMPYDAKITEFGRLAGLRHSLTAAHLDSPDSAVQAVESFLQDSAVPPLPPDVLQWQGPVMSDLISHVPKSKILR